MKINIEARPQEIAELLQAITSSIEKRYEMNKQELIEKLREHGAWCTECHDINGKKDRYVKSAKVRELLDRLDEPQKVKVPEEFDEWYQQIKQQRGFSEMIARHFALWKICQFGFGHDFEDVSHERTPLDLSVWVSDHKDEAVHAILNGYEVEKEPKYFVELKTLGRSYFLIQNLTMFGEIHTQLNEARENPYAKKWKSTFTKKEIKSIDERYWAFAVPVEQVEV